MQSRSSFPLFSGIVRMYFCRRVFVAAAAVALGGSCVRPAAFAGTEADASINGFRAELRDFNAALMQVRTDLRAGGDVNQNDKWTLRLLGLGVSVLGLTYPVGKIIWIATSAVARRTGSALRAPQSLSHEDYYAFRESLGRRSEMIVRA